MKAHITGFFWGLNKRATPFLKLNLEGDIEKYYPIKRNTKIKIIKDYGKKCVGYFKDNEYHKCPNNSNIQYGWKCRLCQLKDDYLICAKCNGKECKANEKIKNNCLNKTHFLYLTIIGNQLKVGITKAGRFLRRWIEQGSDYSCIIDSGNGMEVRKKEYEMSFKIKDRIKTTTKIKLFEKENKELLKNYLEKNNIKVPIINVRKYYDGLNKIPKKPINNNELMNGRIVCVKGKIIIYEKENEYYYQNINELIGHIMEIEIN